MPAAVIMVGLGASGALTAIGAGIATAIGATSLVGTAAATAIGAGVVSGGITAVSGGSASDVLKSAVLGGVTSYAGSAIAGSVASSVTNSILSSGSESLISSSIAESMGRVAGSAVGGGITSGTRALLEGEDPIEALLKGGITGALTSTVTESVDYALKDVPGFGRPANAHEAALQRSVKSAIGTAILTGGDEAQISNAIVNSYINTMAMAAGRVQFNDNSNNVRQANDAYRTSQSLLEDNLSKQQELAADYNRQIEPIQTLYAKIQDDSKTYDDLANKFNNFNSIFKPVDVTEVVPVEYGGYGADQGVTTVMEERTRTVFVDENGNPAPSKEEIHNQAMAVNRRLDTDVADYKKKNIELFGGEVTKYRTETRTRPVTYFDEMGQHNYEESYEVQVPYTETVVGSVTPIKKELDTLQSDYTNIGQQFDANQNKLTDAINEFYAAELKNAEITKAELDKFANASKQYKDAFGVDPTQEQLTQFAATGDILDNVNKFIADNNNAARDPVAVPGADNITNIFSGPSTQVAQSGDPSADLAIIDSLSPDKQNAGTSTVTAPDGSQLVYDQDNNLVDIIPAPDQSDSTAINQPDALVPDENNPNLEPGKTPQQRADEEWQRYLNGLGTKPADLDLPGSTIDAGEYWEEYNQNLKRIMDEGGYTSQWQKANGDRIFINDDGTGIGINENGGTYALSDTEVESMVEGGLLNTADSGYVEATGGTGDTPGGADRCGNGFHWDESRQMCIPDEDEEPKSQDCPEGYVFDLNTQSCVPVGSSSNRVGGGNGQLMPNANNFAGAAGALNFLFGPQTSGSIPASTVDKPMQKSGLPIYGKMDKFEGPLEDFLEMVSEGSYVNQPAQQPQQANNMNMPNQMDRIDQQPSYFNYGKDTSIDQNLFGGQNSINYENQMFNRQSPLNYDQQSFDGQNSMNYGQQSFANPSPFKTGGLAVPLMADGGTTRYGRYAGGGLNVVEHAGKQRLDFRKGAAVTGKGDGQSDDIPAMLADGEFVFPADVVAALGNGSTKAGSDKLYDMMHSIRAYHRSAKPKDLPPPAKKSPLDYLKKPARKARG